MPYKLKRNQPEFDVVDGLHAGKKYRHGEVYPDIPPSEKNRFEAVTVPRPKPTTPPAAKKNDVSADSGKTMETKKPPSVIRNPALEKGGTDK